MDDFESGSTVLRISSSEAFSFRLSGIAVNDFVSEPTEGLVLYTVIKNDSLSEKDRDRLNSGKIRIVNQLVLVSVVDSSPAESVFHPESTTEPPSTDFTSGKNKLYTSTYIRTSSNSSVS